MPDLLATGLLLAALAQSPGASAQFDQLDSGLRVVVVADRTLPLVSIQLWYHVGQADDPPDAPGLCAVTQALLEQRDGAALRLLAAGARCQSRILREACCFATLVPPELVEYVLAVEAERLRPLRADAEAVARAVRAAARRCREGVAGRAEQAERCLLAAMFPAHPYGQPPGFVAESLGQLSPERVARFARRWFVPANATLFMVGDVAPAEVLAQVRQRFAGLPRCQPPARRMPPRPAVAKLELAGPRPACGAAATLVVGWLTSPFGSFDNVALDVLMHGLLNPIDGPLRRRLSRQGLEPQRIGWQRWAGAQAGLLRLELSFADERDRSATAPAVHTQPADRLRAALREIDAALHEAETRIPAELAHNRARALAVRDVRAGALTLGGRATYLAECEVVGGNLLLAEYRTARIRQVGVPDVQTAARLLNTTRRVVIMCRPDGVPGLPATGDLPATPDVPEARRLDAGELLTLLRTHAPDPPPPAGMPPHPASERIDGCVPVWRCPLRRGNSVTIALLDHEAPAAPTALGCELLDDLTPAPDDAAARLADYASYHGLVRHELARIPQGRWCGWAATGDSDNAVALLECFAQLRAERPSGGTVGEGPSQSPEVFVIGELERERLAHALATLSAPEPSTGRHAAASRPTPEPARAFRRRPASRRSALVTVRLGLPDPEQAGMSPLEARALALLLGRVPHDSAALGGDAEPLWRDWLLTPRELSARARLLPAELPDALHRLRTRLDALRAGMIAGEQLSLAVRLARVEELTRLDGPVGILQALAWWRADPWVAAAEPTADNVEQRLRAVADQLRLSVGLTGGEANQAGRLRAMPRDAAGNANRTP